MNLFFSKNYNLALLHGARLHGAMGYDIIVFNLEHSALTRGVMEDHGALPQGVVQYNHGVVR
jgi:hypothetical protein